jgi:drug/metabolite transporter (DMT)-like permease
MPAFAAIRGLYTGATGNTKGVALMLFATVAFICMQSLIRHAGETLPPFEVAFFRNIFGLAALAPIFIRHGLTPLKTKRFKMHAGRGSIQAFGMMAFFYGVTLIPFAEVTALSFSGPLFATVIALVFLGERMRIRRMTALVLGFIGMVMVVRPGFAEVNLGTWLILGSSITWGISIAFIKILSMADSGAAAGDGPDWHSRHAGPPELCPELQACGLNRRAAPGLHPPDLGEPHRLSGLG